VSNLVEIGPGHRRHEGLLRDDIGYLKESWRAPRGPREVRRYATGAYCGDTLLIVDGIEVERGALAILDCVFSGDGSRLAYAKRQAGRELLIQDGRVWVDTGGGVRSVSFSPDGTQLAWRLELRAPPGSSTSFEHRGYIDGVEVVRYPYQPWGLDWWDWLPPWHPEATEMPAEFQRAKARHETIEAPPRRDIDPSRGGSSPDDGP
jgi:hypothetical protein